MVWLSCRSSTRAGEGNSLLGEAFLGKQIYSPIFKFVYGADDTYLLIVDKRFEDRRGGIKFLNIQRDVAADGICKEIAGRALHSIYRRGESRDQSRQMTGERGTIFDGLDSRIECPAGTMTEYHD
jgi:hypothetical protein